MTDLNRTGLHNRMIGNSSHHVQPCYKQWSSRNIGAYAFIYILKVFDFFSSRSRRVKATLAKTMESVFLTFNTILITVTVWRDLLGVTVKVCK